MKTNAWYPVRPSTRAIVVFVAALAVFSAACGKKTPIAPPPPPPTPTEGPKAPAPNGPSSASVTDFTVEPATIERGQTAVLRWATTGATEVSINNGIGTVAASGTRSVRPDATTTYTLTATGSVGSTTRSATVSVTMPAPPPPPAPVIRSNIGTLESRVASDLQDALFDYDSNNIRDDARAALTADASALQKIFTDFPNASINLEGHCDERGSAEYNLGLGDRRAAAAREFLVQLGIPAAKIKTISYGKERPQCTEGNESCWQRNRRAHFSANQ
jgi:peptidoglycan-associated lipoprotein